MPYVDHGGAIDVTNFSFSFGDRHCFIVKLHSFGGLSAAEQNETLSHAKSLVTTNQSYELATNWLRLLDVDIAKLEAANKPEVRQRWFWVQGTPLRNVLLPIFYVRWGPWEDATVEVMIDGRTRDLLELREKGQQAYTRKPSRLVNDLERLLAITDEEFLGYSSDQRSNLVARFAVNWAFSNPTGVTPTTATGPTNALPAK
jgi:hypothetical protein